MSRESVHGFELHLAHPARAHGHPTEDAIRDLFQRALEAGIAPTILMAIISGDPRALRQPEDR